MNSQAPRHDGWVAVLVALLVCLRMSFVSGDSFSYDYANYMAFMRAIADLDWSGYQESLVLTAPYILVPGGGVLEFGFVALAKFMLGFWSPTGVYAVMAGASVGLRVWVMRRFSLGWPWVILAQLYAITLLEANALRAGMALSVTLLGLWMLSRRAPALGVVVMLLAATLHLQVALFIAPLLLLFLVPVRWLRYWPVALSVVLVSAVGVLVAAGLAASLDISKLDDYEGRTSGAVGLNLISGLSLILLATGLLVSLRDGPRANAEALQNLGLRVQLAAAPSLALLLFAVQLSAIGDRAWQFALLVVVAVSACIDGASPWRRWRDVVMGLLFAVALGNTLVRYPLSNFFAPPLPYERIQPLWLVL